MLEHDPEMGQGNNRIEVRGESAQRAIQLLERARIFVREVAQALSVEQLEEVRERRFGDRVAKLKTVRWNIPRRILDTWS